MYTVAIISKTNGPKGIPLYVTSEFVTSVGALEKAQEWYETGEFFVTITDEEGEVQWKDGKRYYEEVEDTRDTMADLLEQYSHELGLTTTITLQEIINSHRRLREFNRTYNMKCKELFSEAWEHGLKEAREHVENNEYVSIERLRQMAISELRELLRD